MKDKLRRKIGYSIADIILIDALQYLFKVGKYND